MEPLLGAILFTALYQRMKLVLVPLEPLPPPPQPSLANLLTAGLSLGRRCVVSLVYHALSGYDPSYLLTTAVSLRTCPTCLRSANTRTLLVSRTRTNFGDRTSNAAGPRI